MRPPLSPDIAPDGPAVLERLGAVLARHLGGSGVPEPVALISGNVNVILKIRYDGHNLGVRLAQNTYRFKYEKDIIKEIFALFLIYYARDAENDTVARGIIDNVLASPVGSHVGHTLVRRVLHYDWSMETLPWPFFIYEWIDGEILWRIPTSDHYAAAGRNLARLHRITFDAYYADIFRIGREPLDWTARFERALAVEAQQAETLLPPNILKKLRTLDVAALPSTPPRLVHNDYSGGNIIVDGTGGQKIIDWDNWVVEAPELDLLKMKYWTAIGPDGLLAPVPALYSAFLEGYKSEVGTGAVAVPLDEGRMRAYEFLWLTRAYTFESARRRETPGGTRLAGSADLARHYPPASVYQDWLGDL